MPVMQDSSCVCCAGDSYCADNQFLVLRQKLSDNEWYRDIGIINVDNFAQLLLLLLNYVRLHKSF